jgi:tRNA A-37 threonylcarbamoyl transferase component Bud32
MEKINENNDEKEKINNNVNTNDSESIYGKEQQENNVEKEKIKLNKKPALSKSNSKGNKPKLSITDFSVSQTLGRGAYAKVVKGEHKGKSYAIKVIDKKFIEKYEKIHEVHTEKQILSSISHPNIIKMHFTFQDSKNLYFVLDYCSNKDFSDFLKTRVILSKELAQYYTAEIVYVLDYLRKNGISHRDLKPENIMLDEKMKIKIVSIILNNIILFILLNRSILQLQLKKVIFLTVRKTNLLLLKILNRNRKIRKKLYTV